MEWKEWPYWLKGGIIGGCVLFVYRLIAVIAVMLMPNMPRYGLSWTLLNKGVLIVYPFIPIMYFASIPFMVICAIFRLGEGEAYLYCAMWGSIFGMLICCLIAGFVYGSLIWLVIGKIKSKIG